MIGDPVYDALQRQRKARETKAASARSAEARRPHPEGVTVYQCNGVIRLEPEEDDDPLDSRWRFGCGAIFEQKPYHARPWCHGSPARIQRYDWDRDV